MALFIQDIQVNQPNLLFEGAVVHSGREEPRRCASLESRYLEAERVEGLGETDGRPVAHPAGGPHVEPDVDAAPEERAGGQYDTSA